MGFIFSVFWGSNLCSHARFKGGKSQCALTPTHKLCPLSVKAVIQTDTYTLSSGLTGVFTFKDHSVFCFGGFNTWRIQSGIYSFITWWTDPCNKMLFKTGSRMEKEGGGLGGGKQCQSFSPSSHIPPRSFVFTSSKMPVLSCYFCCNAPC